MSLNSVQLIIPLYRDEKKSLREVAEITGNSKGGIQYHLMRHGIEVRKPSEGISLARKRWARENAKGYRITKTGYAEYTMGEHKHRLVHVVKMEQFLGRSLASDEQVHHKDGDKLNNDIENLQVLTRSEHASIHARINHTKRERNDRGQFKSS